MGNFRPIRDDLLRRGAARQVADAAALTEQVSALLGDSERRQALATAAAAWSAENGGAVARTLEVLRRTLA
jgi:3-deoxy-D-manno-octulosonic-acid transferase